MITDLARSQYVDFVEYTPFFVSFHILTSTDRRELNGMLRISYTLKGINSTWIRSSSQLAPFSVIKAQTLVFIGKWFWGERTLLECKPSSHLSPLIRTLRPSPIRHEDPKSMTWRALSMLCHALDPVVLTPSSMIEQDGKNLALNTL